MLKDSYIKYNVILLFLYDYWIMSIDREFRFLNQSKNSLNDWKNQKNSIDKWMNKTSKMNNYVWNYAKYLALVFMLTAWSVEVFKNNFNKGTWGETAMATNDRDYIFKTNSNDIKLSKYLFDIEKDNSESDNLILTDDNYEKNYISGIPLDEEHNYTPWTHMKQTVEETFYLSMCRKLSDEDYKDMFKWLKNLEQWNFGNCYFVIALKTLARSKYFDTLIKTSLEKNGDNSFNLYMPLWEPWWNKITVSSEDLKASTIRWPIWYKILEVWFAKYLLFKEWIIPNADIIMTDGLMNKMRSWSTWNAMMSLLWQENFVNKSIENHTINRRGKIMKWLNNYDPKNLWTMFVASKVKEWKTDKNFYEVWGERIYYNHAYSVCGVEKDWNKITNIILDNPWNDENKIWWSKIKLGVNDFLNSFYIVNIGHINWNFLDLSTSQEKIKVFDSVNRKNL